MAKWKKLISRTCLDYVKFGVGFSGAMWNEQEDLDLLLSLQERVLETPPGSPGYDSDDGERRRKIGQADMSVFRNAAADCLDSEPQEVSKNLQKSKSLKILGLLRNRLLTPEDISNHFADIRFVQLPAIKPVTKINTPALQRHRPTVDTKGKQPALVKSQVEEPKKFPEKMIELDFISSDEEL